MRNARIFLLLLLLVVVVVPVSSFARETTGATLRRFLTMTTAHVETPTVPISSETITTITASPSVHHPNDSLSSLEATPLQPQPIVWTSLPLLNFTLHLNQPVPNTDLLVQSMQEYLQVGFLWDIQNVTWVLESESSSSLYDFGPGTLRVDATMDPNVIRQEQVSLLQDTPLLEYVLQQHFSLPELHVLHVQFGEEPKEPNHPNDQAMFASPLSYAQRTLLLIASVLVVASIAGVVCLRRYRQMQKPL